MRKGTKFPDFAGTWSEIKQPGGVFGVVNDGTPAALCFDGPECTPADYGANLRNPDHDHKNAPVTITPLGCRKLNFRTNECQARVARCLENTACPHSIMCTVGFSLHPDITEFLSPSASNAQKSGT